MSQPSHTYTIILDRDPETGTFAVSVPALPGCFTHGATLEECMANARDVIALYLEDLVASGEPIPEEVERPQLLSVTVAA